MSSYLLDSGLVIGHLRGQRRAVQLLRGLGRLGRLSISAVTRLEIHAGMLPEERHATQKLLSRFATVDLDGRIADLAGDLIRESRERGITSSVPDAVIAASALAGNLTLVTRNRAHFAAFSGLSLYPLPDDEP